MFVMLGGLLSLTVIKTESDDIPPFPSSTVSVMSCVPAVRLTVGVGPSTVPKEPVQVNVSGSPSGSAEPAPLSVIAAVQSAPACTVWSGPASATGGLLGILSGSLGSEP